MLSYVGKFIVNRSFAGLGNMVIPAVVNKSLIEDEFSALNEARYL